MRIFFWFWNVHRGLHSFEGLIQLLERVACNLKTHKVEHDIACYGTRSIVSTSGEATGSAGRWIYHVKETTPLEQNFIGYWVIVGCFSWGVKVRIETRNMNPVAFLGVIKTIVNPIFSLSRYVSPDTINIFFSGMGETQGIFFREKVVS